jgi:23S rRNA (uracil-5-)-methyltransferase RumA
MEPKCKYFNKCGGCSAQHIDYSIQLDNKKKVLQQCTGFDDIEVFSDKEYNYRNRMDLIFTYNGLGFREEGKWNKVINIDRCEIADERINELITEIQDNFKEIDVFNVNKQYGTYKFAVMRATRKGTSISFTLNSDSKKLKDAVDKIKEYSKVSKADNIVITYVEAKENMAISDDFFVVKGKSRLEEEFLGKEFTFSVQGFFQNNTIMAEKMHDYVNSILKKYDTKTSHLLDLYGGVGTFGIINASLFKGVTIVEEFEGSITAAKKNLRKNNVEAEAIAMDAKQIIKLKLPRDLVVINDPPRSGMNVKTIKTLNELKPKLIIYISCNPKQLCKELAFFNNYKIKSAAMFDLFPHTPHSEAVIELILN